MTTMTTQELLDQNGGYLTLQNFPSDRPDWSYLLDSDALCTNDPMKWLPIYLLGNELHDQIELGGRVVDALIQENDKAGGIHWPIWMELKETPKMSVYDLPHEEYVATLQQNTSAAVPGQVRVMDLEGFIKQVAFRLDEMGISERPTYAQHVDAWASQVCAKKMAATFKRRLHKRKAKA